MTIWNMEITASESPQTVHIPLEGKYYAIKNTGESDILVSSYVANPTEGADDVMKILSGSAAIIPVKDGDLYVSSEEDGTYSISIQDDKVIPWSGGTGSGGSGGDTTHYRGTTTTPLENGSTTNPIVIDGESYTAVFGDVVVYGYTEFVFDGTAWSEFGRPFDTTPTSGSTNAVTSDGVYQRTPFARGLRAISAVLGTGSRAENENSISAGVYTVAQNDIKAAFGVFNKPNQDDLFEIGNGTNVNQRSNIVEVNKTRLNVNGDIKINNVSIPTPYTTMPTITESMLGQIAQYVGTTGGGYVQGCFYIASTDGAAEPTYSWVKIGGGYSETVLWENSEATSPDTITLSEAYTGFDALAIRLRFGSDNDTYASVLPTSLLTVGWNELLWGFGSDIVGNYIITSTSVFTKNGVTGVYIIDKIIGIKY